VIVGLVAHGAVYAVDFTIVDRLVLSGSHDDVFNAARFAVVDGWLGLVFAALAPAGLGYGRKPRPVVAVSEEAAQSRQRKRGDLNRRRGGFARPFS
jgi:hypothetical protein